MSTKNDNSDISNGSTAFEILYVLEYGMSDSWDWVGMLTQMTGGTYSFELYQVLYTEGGEDGPYCHLLDSFSSGDELFEFIQNAWRDDHFEGLAEKLWQEIVDALENIDKSLAFEVAKSVREEFYGPAESSEGESISPAEDWARRAVWERQKFGGGGGQWAGIAESLRAAAAIRFYIQRYLLSHGKLPNGNHNVIVSFGTLEDGADCRPPSNASQPAVFQREVKFPDD